MTILITTWDKMMVAMSKMKNRNQRSICFKSEDFGRDDSRDDKRAARTRRAVKDPINLNIKGL